MENEILYQSDLENEQYARMLDTIRAGSEEIYNALMFFVRDNGIRKDMLLLFAERQFMTPKVFVSALELMNCGATKEWLDILYLVDEKNNEADMSDYLNEIVLLFKKGISSGDVLRCIQEDKTCFELHELLKGRVTVSGSEQDNAESLNQTKTESTYQVTSMNADSQTAEVDELMNAAMQARDVLQRCVNKIGEQKDIIYSQQQKIRKMELVNENLKSSVSDVVQKLGGLNLDGEREED